MPFSRPGGRQPSYTDGHDYHHNNSYSSQQWPEQEMDFTRYANMDQTTLPTSIDTSTSMMTSDYFRPTISHKSSVPDMFNTGSFDFTDLVRMDSDTVSPLDMSSASSVRTSSVGNAPCLAYQNASNNGLLVEKICPLMAGDTDVCEPSKCGPDAPCMNFSSLPQIEDCASVPCMTPPEKTSTSRSSTRMRRPMHTARSSTQTSSTSIEDHKATVTRRPTGRTPIEKPLSKLDKKQRAKQAHSLVEKKYRENLNTKLQLLHNTLQTAQFGPNRYQHDAADSDLELDEEDSYDAPQTKTATRQDASNNKFRKSEVLDDAMAYVNQTEVEMRHMETEMIRLSDRVKLLEKLVRCEDCSLLKRMVTLQVQNT